METLWARFPIERAANAMPSSECHRRDSDDRNRDCPDRSRQRRNLQQQLHIDRRKALLRGDDVRANPNPNELARKAADETARDFKCGKDEVKIVGSRGRAVELAKR